MVYRVHPISHSTFRAPSPFLSTQVESTQPRVSPGLDGKAPQAQPLESLQLLRRGDPRNAAGGGGGGEGKRSFGGLDTQGRGAV